MLQRFAIQHHMPVVDDLTGGKNSWHHFRTIQNGIKACFQNTDQILPVSPLPDAALA